LSAFDEDGFTVTDKNRSFERVQSKDLGSRVFSQKKTSLDIFETSNTGFAASNLRVREDNEINFESKQIYT